MSQGFLNQKTQLSRLSHLVMTVVLLDSVVELFEFSRIVYSSRSFAAPASRLSRGLINATQSRAWKRRNTLWRDLFVSKILLLLREETTERPLRKS